MISFLKKYLLFIVLCAILSEYDSWLHGQAVKTLASHAGIRGSIPLGVIIENPQIFLWIFLCFLKKEIFFCEKISNDYIASIEHVYQASTTYYVTL